MSPDRKEFAGLEENLRRFVSPHTAQLVLRSVPLGVAKALLDDLSKLNLVDGDKDADSYKYLPPNGRQ